MSRSRLTGLLGGAALLMLVAISSAGALPEPRRGGLGIDPAARPLRLPESRAETDCVRDAARFVGAPGIGSAAGPDPVSVVQDGAVAFSGFALVGPDQRLIRTLDWLASDHYDGPILLRGARLSDGQPIRFIDDRDDPAPAGSTQLTTSDPRSRPIAGDWRHWQVMTLFPGFGCYAYQVDGIGFSHLIRFQVVAVP